jgi:hypothetical protein
MWSQAVQTAAALASLASFGLGVWSAVGRSAAWTYALSFALFLLLAGLAIHKRRRASSPGTLVQEGSVEFSRLPWEREIYYPQPFRSPPFLEISFPEQDDGCASDSLGLDPQGYLYELLTQNGDGFKIRCRDDYEHEVQLCGPPRSLKWRATGVAPAPGLCARATEDTTDSDF